MTRGLAHTASGDGSVPTTPTTRTLIQFFAFSCARAGGAFAKVRVGNPPDRLPHQLLRVRFNRAVN